MALPERSRIAQVAPFLTDLKNLQSLSSRNGENAQIPPQIRHFYQALSGIGNYRALKKLIDLNKFDLTDGAQRHHLYIAFAYAMQRSLGGRALLNGRSPITYDPDLSEWKNVVKAIISDRDSGAVLAEKMETNMQAVSPSLAPTVRLVINRLNVNNQKLIVHDLGCGQNFDLPIIASSDSTETVNFKPQPELARYNHAINLEEGIGVDNNPHDLEWSKLCTLSWNPTREAVSRWNKVTPLRIKLRDEDGRVKTVESSVLDYAPEPGKEADFVITKKMRYELPDQNGIKETIIRTLKDDGYYISVGEEAIVQAKAKGKRIDPLIQDIWVFQKRGKSLVPVVNEPVIMADYTGRILSYSGNFF